MWNLIFLNETQTLWNWSERHRLCPYNGCVWRQSLPLLSAQRCTWLYLIKWSTRHYKEEIMTAWNDCFVLQSLECGAIMSSPQAQALSIFPFSCWVYSSELQLDDEAPTSGFVLRSIHPLKAGLPLQKTLPALCPVWSEVSHLIIKLRSLFFLEDDSLVL